MHPSMKRSPIGNLHYEGTSQVSTPFHSVLLLEHVYPKQLCPFVTFKWSRISKVLSILPSVFLEHSTIIPGSHERRGRQPRCLQTLIDLKEYQYGSAMKIYLLTLDTTLLFNGAVPLTPL